MQPNRVIIVNNVKAVLRWWPFFREGFKAITETGGLDITEETYLKILMHVATLPVKRGRVTVLVSGAGQPYGYLVAIDITNKFSTKTVNIYAFYTNNKCPAAVIELAADAKTWARESGFEVVQACSTKFGGAAIRWFQKKMGFGEKMIVYSQRL